MQSVDDVTWARRVNSRWFVRESLRDNAAAYMDHLAAADQERLSHSCRCARLLTERFGDAEDPKPWFYAGLFSLATAPEGERFLAKHDFTIATIPGLDSVSRPSLGSGNVATETREKIERIRRMLEDPTL